MKAKLYLVMAMLCLLALLIGACASEPSPPSGEVSPIPPTDLKVTDAAEVRNTALAYLREYDAHNAPSADILWQEQDVTPPDCVGPDCVGAVHKEFTSDEWIITVVCPVMPPEMRVYQVVISSPFYLIALFSVLCCGPEFLIV